jgi:hypothetical protein
MSEMNSAEGRFEVKLAPQADVDFPVGRMTIDKTYQGDVEGTGIGQMISKRMDIPISCCTKFSSPIGYYKRHIGI